MFVHVVMNHFIESTILLSESKYDMENSIVHQALSSRFKDGNMREIICKTCHNNLQWNVPVLPCKVAKWVQIFGQPSVEQDEMHTSLHHRLYQNSELDDVPLAYSDSISTDINLPQQYKYVCTCCNEPFYQKHIVVFSDLKYDMENSVAQQVLSSRFKDGDMREVIYKTCHNNL